jgi:hypothetical protein
MRNKATEMWMISGGAARQTPSYLMALVAELSPKVRLARVHS